MSPGKGFEGSKIHVTPSSLSLLCSCGSRCESSRPMSADCCFLPDIMDSSLLELLAPINSSIRCLGHGVFSQHQKSNSSITVPTP